VCALLAGAAVLAGATILAVLHVLPADRRVDPVSQPLSEFAFMPYGWLFDVAVSALALGLLLLVGALVRGRCLTGRAPARALLTICSLSLILIVVFPEHEPDGAVRIAGRIHWVATMLAFGGLTVAPVLLGSHRASVCSRLTTLARRLSVGSGPCLLVVLVASLLQYETRSTVPAWSFGVAERVLVTLEFALAGVLTAWAWRGCACDRAHLVACETPRDAEQASASIETLPVRPADHDSDVEPAPRLIA
jgi:hypothetical membrane protein